MIFKNEQQMLVKHSYGLLIKNIRNISAPIKVQLRLYVRHREYGFNLIVKMKEREEKKEKEIKEVEEQKDRDRTRLKKISPLHGSQ